MIKYYSLLFCCLLLGSLSAQDGISFSEGSFDELVARAKAEDKLVFVDAYTTWCGPCKMMAAKIFPDARVGEVYNERFVNAKIDMEKGEGPALASRFGVAAYPTYLFVNGAGELVHKGLGYIPKDAFLELADAATGPNSLGAMNARYDGGDRDGDFVKSYAETLTDMMENERATEVIDTYLDNEEDWSTEDNLRLILASPGEPGDKRMIFLVEHAAEVIEAVGSGQFIQTVQNTMAQAYVRANPAGGLPEVTDIEEFYTQFAAPIKDRLLLHFSTVRSQMIGDYPATVAATLAYFEKYPSNDYRELNSAAWTLYEHSEDPTELATALGWAKQSVELREYYPNLDTLAWLYKKTGQDELAKQTATKAIELAKAAGIDASETEALLEE